MDMCVHITCVILIFQHNLGPFSTSCGSLTETLLKQIFELTGHINQLTEEKKDLQKIIMKLEEQIKFYEQTKAGISDVRLLTYSVYSNLFIKLQRK